MIGAALLDKALDRSVVGGYTNVGYRLRRRGWSERELPSMRGRTVLVTGATSGLGLAAAEGFARLGADVRLLARDRERGELVLSGIASRHPQAQLELCICDLSDLSSIRSFAEQFSAANEALHVLVNNAGAMRPALERSVDGVELAFATNVLGPFLLTNLLLGLLRRSAPARVINVSSGGMYTQELHTEDLQSERGDYDGPAVYARTKRAEVVLTEMWAQRLKGSGVVVHAMHPGWADTPGVRSSLPRFHRAMSHLLRTPEEGADTILWLAAAAEPERSSGGFWHDRRMRPTHMLPWTRDSAQERERLWEECERLSGWHEADSRSASPSKSERKGT